MKVFLPVTYPKSDPPSFTLSSCWVSIDQLETLVSNFYQYQNESMIHSWICSLQSSLGSIGQSEWHSVQVVTSGLCSSSPDLSLEKLSNSLGNALHVRFIKPNVKYIELDAVVGTVQGS